MHFRFVVSPCAHGHGAGDSVAGARPRLSGAAAATCCLSSQAGLWGEGGKRDLRVLVSPRFLGVAIFCGSWHFQGLGVIGVVNFYGS